MTATSTERLATARDFHVQGHLDRAEPLYREIIEADPENGEAWHLLGVLMLQKGQGADAESYLSRAVRLNPTEAKYYNNLSSAQKLCGKLAEAEQSLRQAIEVDPRFADGHVNLGNLLSEAERYDETILSLRAALEQYPEIAELHLNLGHALFQLGRLDDAKPSCLKALELKPDLGVAQNVLGGIYAGLDQLPEAIAAYQKALKAEAGTITTHLNLGLIYRTQRQIEAAESSYRKALTMEPENVDVLVGLASVLMEAGRKNDAIESFKQALAIDPENGDAKHMVAALTGETTETAPEAYVKSLFDFYAPNFDQDLAERLQYKIPFQMREVVDQYFAEQEPAATPDFTCLLDQGCGTGMVGEAFQNCADEMIGLDLAPKMIAAATQKDIYSELHEIELTDYLAGALSAERKFDIVTAADVFIYVGKLDDLFAATVKRLQAGALYVFSVENSNSDDFVLRNSGRYAQSRAYIEKLANANGFRIEVAEPAKIRKHGNEFMPGTIYILKYA
jgi:predicted TPR repeat methyltransferase